ncbi:MAG TPA: c-type cytochrome [Gemmatimonadales bacterium]|nr:c-type cytochrome [Gemmatimonadales bacterium]
MRITYSRPCRALARTLVLASCYLGVAHPPLSAQGTDTTKLGQGYLKEFHSAPRDTIPQTAYLGWKQFELNCSRCHGEYGVGTSFAPALVVSLKHGGTIPNEQTFIQTVCAGRPEKGMPSWCALGLEIPKMQAIYAYLKGRADGKIGIGRPAVRPDSAGGKT